METPYTLSANEAARHIREGRLSSVDLVKSCLARIDETDDAIKAWVYVDREGALAPPPSWTISVNPVGPLARFTVCRSA